MGKPKNIGRGFSAARPAPASKQQVSKNSAQQAAKEQRAAALIDQGKLQEAEATYRDLIATGTNNHVVYVSLAAICGMHGRFDELISLLKKALDLKPNQPEAHYGLGIAYKEQGDLTAAIASYRKALKLNPNYPNAHNNLGNALKDQGDLPAAIASYRKALELKPNHPEAHYNLGVAHQAQGDLTAAIASYNNALELKPNRPEAYNNLGNALKDLGDLSAAIASYQKALELKPDDVDAQKNLSMAELLAGDYESGWQRYECRFYCKQDAGILSAKPKCNKCNSRNLNAIDQLLLVSEQGLGDTLQFMRYAIALRDQGTTVLLCAQPKLHGLIQASGIDLAPLTPEQANAVTEGFWMPLLSVPGRLDVSPENPIITEPYIKAADELVAKWKGILAGEKRPIIGINCQGNRTDNRKVERNFPIDPLINMAKRLDFRLVSLQRETARKDPRPSWLGGNLQDAQYQIHRLVDSDVDADFHEYAAVIANCDLVISTATTVCHLAAAMGIKTWTLLQKVPEWRWGLKDDTTFWYPSMRLFRQTERGCWDDVLQRLEEALQNEFPGVAAADSAVIQARHAQARSVPAS
jgi:Flp pilus assembly protein TadD